MKEVELKSDQYNCKNCGSILHFDPQTKSLKCDECKSTFKLERAKTFKRHNLDNNLDETSSRNEWIEDNKVFKCTNCGSSIIANKYEISKTCPYCNTNLILDTTALPGLKPDAVVPFVFDKAEASQRFVQNVKKKFYVNGKFKRCLPENKISATYIPSFVYDMQTNSTYRGVLSRSSTYNGHTTTTTFSISGSLNKKYSNIIVESSSKINQNELRGILPYDMSAAVDYKNGFILGYTVEHYADTLKTCEKIAQQTISSLIRKDVLSRYSYDSVQRLNIDTQYSDKKFNYVLVPIYKFEYNFKNKPYKTFMNGQNGKVDNNLPKSIPKIVMTVLLVLLIILLPFILSFLGD